MAANRGLGGLPRAQTCPQTTTINTCCPPGLRAKKVFTRKYRPRKRTATRGKWSPMSTSSSAHRTTPNGKTPDLTGGQVRGPRVPAPT
ncbi:Hypothetical predicted protein [Pelobates cultripes]|uniref:Uncharacterized protein n=1 Tax=Pelobates cultripes TaxID=61616 RepID=A0AAD1T7D5_PELCU|nr:Hypothetical predicted protein [Pelobates cultripes]